MKEAEERRFDRQFGMARLAFLLLHLVAILINLQDQTRNISLNFPEIQSGSTESRQVSDDFRAGCTMGLMFTVMQLIILYVGTNRFRIKPTAYTLALHLVGLCLYCTHNRWLFQNIWTVVGLFSFLPAVSEIAVALYTAQK